MASPTPEVVPSSSVSAALESPWKHKPWWCQPWSIVLTGITVTGGSWLLLHRVWVTALVALPIGAWMGFFLLLWPKLMQQAMAEGAEIED
ncbi:MAG: hypothetical protein MH252_17465 [Thermosynechococcaceae cyanobacterium MS004]|nr:hypothetical protein [Thermosynechococcaceae cyanobacterium MS004]